MLVAQTSLPLGVGDPSERRVEERSLEEGDSKTAPSGSSILEATLERPKRRNDD